MAAQNADTGKEDAMKDAISVETALFGFHVHEVQHHRDKIRWLIALLLSSSAGILVYQRPQFFNTDQLEWPILIGGLILLTGVYYALVHHSVKLLTKCRERDSHQKILREMRQKLLPEALPGARTSEKFDFNVSIVSGPIAITIVTSMAWLALGVFLNRVWVTSQAVEKVKQALPSITTAEELRATNINVYLIAERLIQDTAAFRSQLSDLLCRMKVDVQRAQTVTVLLMGLWGLISLAGLVFIWRRFSRYWRTHKELFAGGS